MPAATRRIIAAACGTALLLPGRAAVALPPPPTVEQLLAFCASATVAEARGQGSRLGWTRMDEARIAPWRAGFERGSGRAVEVVGWARGPREDDGLLSFWTTPGTDGRRVCSYSVGDASGLLEGLSRVLGQPGRRDATGPVASAGWAWTAGEVSFVQVGAHALVTVTNPR